MVKGSNVVWGDGLKSYNGSAAFTYDEIGNPLTYNNGSAYAFTWQNGRQLASTVLNGVTSSYEYNADGLRTQKTVGSTVYDYYWFGTQLTMMTITEGSTVKTLKFYYDANGTPVILDYNGTTYYYVTNLLGDIVGLANSYGIVAYYEYDAWGKIIATNSASNTDYNAITANPLRYRGYIYDDETGFYYLQSRYYDPTICRFVNADEPEMAFNASITDKNLYAYCDNNPIMRSDDGGEFWNIVIGAAVGAVVSGGISIISQIIENLNNTGSIGEINWASVGVAAASGAISGAFAATGIPVGGQVLINAAIGAISSGIDTYVNKGEEATITDYASSIITGGVVGAIGGLLGGNGTGTKHLSRSAGRLFNKTSGALRHVFKKGVNATIKTITNAGKYYYSQVATESIKCGQKAIIPIIVSNIPNAVNSIWF